MLSITFPASLKKFARVKTSKSLYFCNKFKNFYWNIVSHLPFNEATYVLMMILRKVAMSPHHRSPSGKLERIVAISLPFSLGYHGMKNDTKFVVNYSRDTDTQIYHVYIFNMNLKYDIS